MTILIIFVKSDTFSSPKKSVMLYYAEYVPRSTNTVHFGRFAEERWDYVRCLNARVCCNSVNDRARDIDSFDRDWPGDLIRTKKTFSRKVDAL